MMSGQIFIFKVLGDKCYQLVSDGGFSVQGVVGQLFNKDGVMMWVEVIDVCFDIEFMVSKFLMFGMINNL